MELCCPPLRRACCACVVLLGPWFAAACGPEPEPPPSPPPAATWRPAFDTAEAGSLSSVWGTGPNDVFVVGGAQDGRVFHFDGRAWTRMTVPPVGLLVWVHGRAPNDVYAVGVGGAALHWDGAVWTVLDPGVTDDLWGVFEAAPGDVWVVGGDTRAGEPVLLHHDGTAWERVTLSAAQNPSGASALFKVWGTGDRLWAVGQNGLILEKTAQGWERRGAGALANDDFVSLWGTSADDVVAVGGRGNARIAVLHTGGWTTQAPDGIGGINGVFATAQGQALMVGVNGWAGAFSTGGNTLTTEDTGTTFDLHAVWADGAGRSYAVGGNFLAPHRGVALVRTLP